MAVTVLTPVDLAAPTRIGGRIYRKQVLERREIQYPLPGGEKRPVNFDEEYLQDLAAAFKAGAYDLVPFQLATPANEHNEDPRNYGGKVLGAEVTPEGLDLILELTEETAELVERTDRQLGVSARIKEALEHVDGRRFKRAIRHVLGTLDPRMQGMSAWQPVDLSHNDTDVVIDLTALNDTEDRHMPQLIDLSRLDDADATRLLALAGAAGIDLSNATDVTDHGDPGQDDPSKEGHLGDDGEPKGDEPAGDPDGASTDAGEGGEAGDADTDVIDPLTDAELDALLDDALATADLATPDDDGDALDLATGLASDAHDTAAVATREAGDARYALHLERYGAAGVPPAALDLARPILELGDRSTGDLNLSSPVTGQPIDVHGIVIGLLDTMKGHVDLSAELGQGHDTNGGADSEADDTARRWTDYLGNNS